MVYVSGAGATDLTKDCKGQSEEVFAYIGKVLAAAGCSFKDVVKIQAFVAKQSDYQAYNDVRRKIFPKDPPASTTVVAELVRQEMLVEVEVVAYKDGEKW
jgi:enamine deaminase RidA (YjgF/YER057c/UK114 family)